MTEEQIKAIKFDLLKEYIEKEYEYYSIKTKEGNWDASLIARFILTFKFLLK
jgi:hypothetical protein